MASVTFSTLCLLHKPNSLSFSFLASDKFRFGRVGKNTKLGLTLCRAGSALAFGDLDADEFRHRLDKQNTLILRAIPGLNELGKALLGYNNIKIEVSLVNCDPK